MYAGSPSTRAAREAMEEGDDAGHIIGKLLGGRGGKYSDNIFSQNPGINRGDFAAWEKGIAEEVAKGKRVRVRIEFEYNADNFGTRPDKVKYYYTVDGVEYVKPFPNPVPT
ncbi:MAG: DNA/RNA non-specific endonuclease [Planctomycetaceae bacterium]